MDALKAVLAAKRKAQEEAFQGKKFLKRSELEQVQLKKLKEEEERERQEKASLVDLSVLRRGRMCLEGWLIVFGTSNLSAARASPPLAKCPPERWQVAVVCRTEAF